MDFQLTAAVVFLLALSLFIFANKKKVYVQKILYPVIYFVMYRTKIGLKGMDRISKRFSKILRYVGWISIFIGFLGMLLIAFTLIQNLYKLFFVPEATAGVALVLPFKVKGSFYVPFFYWIISIFILATAHEFFHGVFIRLANVKIKSSGFAVVCALIPIIPAAFVEPDENALKRKKPREQLAVFAAGPFSNIVLGFLFMAVLLLISAPVARTMMDFNGVVISDFVAEDGKIYPAEAAGIGKGEIVQEVNNVSVNLLINFTEALDKTKPGDIALVKTNKSVYNVVLAENPENGNKSYLGVYVQQSQKIKKGFEERYGTILPAVILWLIGLIYWLYALNLGIGLFNLVPIGPVDGGRMLLVVLQKYFKKEKAEKIWKFVSMFFLVLVFANLAFSFIG